MTTRRESPSKRVREALAFLIDRNASSAAISRQVGRADSWLRRILSGELDPELERIEDVLESLEVPLGWFLGRAFRSAEPASPASILRVLSPKGIAPGEDALSLRVQALHDSSIPEAPSRLDTLPGDLEEVEGLRFSKSEDAGDLLDSLITKHLECGQSNAEWLSCSFALRATIHRTSGRNAASCRDFEIAFSLVNQFEESWAFAAALRRAAYLLRDWAEFDEALGFTNRAGKIFLFTSGLRDFAQTLVDQANFHFGSGRHELAKQYAVAARKLLPSEDWRHHAFALQVLAEVENSQARFESAAQLIREALALYEGRREHCSGHLSWTLGRILVDGGEPAEAITVLCQALDQIAELGLPIDVGLVAIELARVYLRLGRLTELRSLGTQIMGLAPILRHDAAVDQILMEFARIVHVEQPTMAFLIETKKRLEEAGRKTRPGMVTRQDRR